MAKFKSRQQQKAVMAKLRGTKTIVMDPILQGSIRKRNALKHGFNVKEVDGSGKTPVERASIEIPKLEKEIRQNRAEFAKQVKGKKIGVSGSFFEGVDRGAIRSALNYWRSVKQEKTFDPATFPPRR